MTQPEALRSVKDRVETDLLQRENVVGVGIGYKEMGGKDTGALSIKVLVRRKLPLSALSARSVVPPRVDGYPTDVVQVGELRALQAPTGQFRPAPGGVSLGHFRVSAGTLSVVVRDRITGERLILSNSHVIANSGDASPGDPVLQPGPVDGGTVDRDLIARLERFCPIYFMEGPSTCSTANTIAFLANAAAILTGAKHRLRAYQTNPDAINQVDAGVARPLSDDLIRDDILEIGPVYGTAPAALGMPVRKFGRTTGFTTGQVTVLDATVDVSYGIGRVARFQNQIVTTAMSQGGDSGSLLVSGDPPLAVGLLFAGSEQSTIHNPIQLVLDCLNVDLLVPTSAQEARTEMEDQEARTQRALAVKEAVEADLLSRPNVVGVGVGTKRKGGQETGQVALIVMVDRKIPAAQLAPEETIPAEIQGVPVDVVEVGPLRAQSL